MGPCTSSFLCLPSQLPWVGYSATSLRRSAPCPVWPVPQICPSPWHSYPESRKKKWTDNMEIIFRKVQTHTPTDGSICALQIAINNSTAQCFYIFHNSYYYQKKKLHDKSYPPSFRALPGEIGKHNSLTRIALLVFFTTGLDKVCVRGHLAPGL